MIRDGKTYCDRCGGEFKPTQAGVGDVELSVVNRSYDVFSKGIFNRREFIMCRECTTEFVKFFEAMNDSSLYEFNEEEE